MKLDLISLLLAATPLLVQLLASTPATETAPAKQASRPPAVELTLPAPKAPAPKPVAADVMGKRESLLGRHHGRVSASDALIFM